MGAAFQRQKQTKFDRKLHMKKFKKNLFKFQKSKFQFQIKTSHSGNLRKVKLTEKKF